MTKFLVQNYSLFIYKALKYDTNTNKYRSMKQICHKMYVYSYSLSAMLSAIG